MVEEEDEIGEGKIRVSHDETGTVMHSVVGMFHPLLEVKTCRSNRYSSQIVSNKRLLRSGICVRELVVRQQGVIVLGKHPNRVPHFTVNLPYFTRVQPLLVMTAYAVIQMELIPLHKVKRNHLPSALIPKIVSYTKRYLVRNYRSNRSAISG